MKEEFINELKSKKVIKKNSCKHSWKYTHYLTQQKNKLPLLRKCTRCGQIQTRAYCEGELTSWENVIIEEDRLSQAEYICQDFNRYIDDLRSQGKCYFLPFTINKIRLRNIRVFQEFEAQFEDFNLVVGDCLTGKTTLVKSIAFIAGLLHLSEHTLLRAGRRKGTIDLVIDMSSMLDTLQVTITKDSFQGLENNGCILLDDSFLLLPVNYHLDFLVFLSGLHKQVILTASESLLSKNHYELIRKNIPECIIISTESGNLKKSC